VPFSRTSAAAAGGTAQLRGRKKSPKIARLAHYNFAPCGVGGRWRARRGHAADSGFLCSAWGMATMTEMPRVMWTMATMTALTRVMNDLTSGTDVCDAD